MNLRYAKRSEDTEQIGIIQWADWNVRKYQELRWLHHVPNGGSRNKQEAVKLKQMGVRAGVSDLHLPFPHGKYHSLYIEMKYGTNRTTKEQDEFLEAMQDAGHLVLICYSTEAGIEALINYLELRQGEELDTSKLTCKVALTKKGILKIG